MIMSKMLLVAPCCVDKQQECSLTGGILVWMLFHCCQRFLVYCGSERMKTAHDKETVSRGSSPTRHDFQAWPTFFVFGSTSIWGRKLRYLALPMTSIPPAQSVKEFPPVIREIHVALARTIAEEVPATAY